MDFEKHITRKHSQDDLINLRKKIENPEYISQAIEELANEICVELIETERHNEIHVF